MIKMRTVLGTYKMHLFSFLGFYITKQATNIIKTKEWEESSQAHRKTKWSNQQETS